MDANEHARNIGILICNLQTLEFQLRSILAWANFPAPSGMPIHHKLADLKEGNEYRAGALTDYDSLRALVVRFNSIAAERGLKPLDSAIVTLRDALAHGRCAADRGEQYFRLIKFSPVKNGRVTVTYNQVLDAQWHDRQRKLLSDALWVLDAARQHP